MSKDVKDNYELEKTIEEALGSVPKEYQDENFSHIAVVARALKSSAKKNPQDDLKMLQDYNQKLEKATKMIVDTNYKAFNKSIRNFSDIIVQLKTSHGLLKGQTREMTTMREQLTSRAEDVTELYATHLEQVEFLSILNSVEQVKAAPKLFEKCIAEKNYFKAVTIVEDALSRVYSDQLKGIAGLDQLKVSLDNSRRTLHETLVDELQKHIYDTSSFMGNEVEMSGTAQKEFVKMIIESLDSLGKLQEAQSRLIQLLRLKLRYLMDTFVTHYFENVEYSSTYLVDLMVGLFKVLKKVLDSKKFIVETIEEKMSDPSRSREISAQEWTSKQDPLSTFDASLNIKLTKEVQEKLRDCILGKLSELRSSRENELYINALEEFLYKTVSVENNVLFSIKAKDIPKKVFMPLIKNMLSLDKHEESANRARLEAIEKDFSYLLLDSFASQDTPKILTMAHTWNTVQDELVKILNDLLGVSDQQTVKAPQFDRIRFRFISNITDVSNEKKKNAISLFSKYITFTPYNLTQIYKPIFQFAKEAASEMDPKNQTKRLVDFLANVMDDSLLPKVMNDYRTNLDHLLEKDEAMKPSIELDIYDSNEKNRPLLYSSVKLVEWIRELFQYATAIPQNKDDFLQIAELLLKRYLEECKLLYSEMTSGKFCGNVLIQSPQLSAFMRKDALVHVLRLGNASPDEIKTAFTQFIDQPLLDLNKKDQILHETSAFILVLNLYDSLEWVARKIELMANWRYTVEEEGYYGLEFFSKAYQELSFKCLFTIKVELRTRTFYYTDSMKAANYYCQEDSTEPELFVTKLNRDLEKISNILTKYTTTKMKYYLFNGIGALSSELLVNILPKLRCKIFNNYGINLLKRDSFALQQNLSNFCDGSELILFDRARRYYDLLRLSDKELFQIVADKDPEFSLNQFKAILGTEGPNRTIRDNAESTLVELWSAK